MSKHGPVQAPGPNRLARARLEREVAMFRNTMPRYEILSPDAINVLDQGWRRIVSEIGVQFAKPEAVREPVAKKKRSKISAKAAAAAIEARIGHKFADPALLATAFTHVSALKKSTRVPCA